MRIELPGDVRLGRAFVDEDASLDASRGAPHRPARRRGTSREAGRWVPGRRVDAAAIQRGPRREQRLPTDEPASACACAASRRRAQRTTSHAAPADRECERRSWTSDLRALGKSATTRATSSSHAAHSPRAPPARPQPRERPDRRPRRGARTRGRAARRRTRRGSRAPCTTGAWSKWTSTIGAVATPHARATASASAQARAADTRPAARARAERRRRSPRRRRTTAGSPGSSTEVGIHAMSTSAPTAKKCHRSAGGRRARRATRVLRQPPARTTEGCQPTASTYAAITPRIASSRTLSSSRSSQPTA